MVNRPNDQVLRAHHLASELSTATELLAVGLNQCASPKWQVRQPGAAFTPLSQGVERALKVTLWLNEENHGRQIDPKFGSGASGHALGELNAKVLDVYTAGSQTANAYMRGLVDEVVADPFWRDILLALDRWAATPGRYRDLDALRGRAAHDDPPWASWGEAEHRAITEVGGWAHLTDEVLATSRRRMLLSIMRWWHTLYRGWQHGLVGAQGVQFSSGLDPKNLHLDPSIAALVAGR
ncbi:hypothetical protein SCB71_17065 [Herbiconiux sp. KACC 21604]|uniref:hypothetical protein n=1 Tax=unclassified Herbiconiux TaxID=2618217 RepID=UPI001491F3A5|nr:hypothetical protein [Herbiconiux sp. SALV-R1]QJU54798.1 hypothetical protein HL652_15020 [Herbiconiux sp. SALV-R1]WPO85912.1 hypothetical protein SCB71_17065 [Herbiconiux sp. KACC 21604]